MVPERNKHNIMSDHSRISRFRNVHGRLAIQVAVIRSIRRNSGFDWKILLFYWSSSVVRCAEFKKTPTAKSKPNRKMRSCRIHNEQNSKLAINTKADSLRVFIEVKVFQSIYTIFFNLMYAHAISRS